VRGLATPMADVDNADLDHAITRAIDFLERAQLASGEFRTLIATDPAMSNAVFDSSPFVTTFVVHALGHVRSSRTRAMIDKALEFLRGEMEFGGLWRYFGRCQYKHCRLPPDLDDTACASDSLRRNGRRPPANRWLFRANRDAAGRFLTWVLPRPKAAGATPLRLACAIADWQAERARRRAPRPVVATDPRLLTTDADPVAPDDVDPVVNANAILYLGESPDTRPAIDWLNAMLSGETEARASHYYPDALALNYMVARTYRHSAPSLGTSSDHLLRNTLQRRQPDGAFGSVLATALAVSVLLTFDPRNPSLAAAIGFIRSRQQRDGSWPTECFYRAPTEFWGSPELTTALCLEALARHRDALAGGAIPG
jgi:hypothetical protein